MFHSSRHSALLYRHFFRRFFDNDTLSMEGDIQTTVIRALSILAVPGLMFAFWLLPYYPGRSTQASMGDRYFFVVYSFAAMGIVTAFQVRMFFPDSSDFLVLLPLPVQTWRLLIAKLKALACFLAIFIAGTNVFGTLLFSGLGTGGYFRQVGAHLCSVSLAGIFSALSILEIQALLICVCGRSWIHLLTPLVQAVCVAIALSMLLMLPQFVAYIRPLMDGRWALARCIPPLWFLGLYESLAGVPGGSEFAVELGDIGLWASAIVALLLAVTYPTAWRFQQRLVIEGAEQRTRAHSALLGALLNRRLLRRPQEKAVFHFITHSIFRDHRYQVYLATYGGVGLAFAMSYALTFRFTSSSVLSLRLSDLGLHATLPLLLFWVVSGLRAAFSFPISLKARWLFLMTQPDCRGISLATRSWVLCACAFVLCCVLAVLVADGWDTRKLVVQALCGIALSFALTETFFLGWTGIPFTRPRLPGRTNLPLALAVYVGVFPTLLLSILQFEYWMEKRPVAAGSLAFAIAFSLHVVAAVVRHNTDKTPFPEEEDQFIQSLGLSSE